MNKYLLYFFFLLASSNASAQQNHFIVCRMSINNSRSKIKITIDYGDKEIFSLLKDTSFLSKTDSVVNYRNEADAIRYFMNLGWEIVGITSTATGLNSNLYYDYIFWRKKIDE
ncbi:MAG: hypothetical protein ACRC0I_08375 [Sediminibacterium sp.]|jgi:hypothetical protein|nr:hypothetical protein [Chitinophagaceae bacterium]